VDSVEGLSYFFPHKTRIKVVKILWLSLFLQCVLSKFQTYAYYDNTDLEVSNFTTYKQMIQNVALHFRWGRDASATLQTANRKSM